MKDPYETLGVQKTDSANAIRAAYRKLAKTHHPDLNPGKPEALERFKEISTAYELLSDADKRARYDRGEIDASGNEVPPQRPFYRDYADAAGQSALSWPDRVRPGEPGGHPGSGIRRPRRGRAWRWPAASISPPAAVTRTTR
jgi:curved DNA-binding protein CbpA